MRHFLPLAVLLLCLFNNHAGYGQNVQLFGCDEIPPNAQAALPCTICSFETGQGTTIGYTPGDPAGWCGTIENDQYIGFIAGPTGGVSFELSVFNCDGPNGLQVGIYDLSNSLVGDCFNQVVNGASQIFSAGGLTPGEVYFMRVDGFGGTQCDFTITVISGLTSAPPDPPGPIMGPRRVCFDDDYTWFINPVTNATGYYWRVIPGVFTAGLTVDPVEATNPIEGSPSPSINITLPERSIAMPRGTCDTVRLEVFPLNPCFSTSDSSVFEFIACNPSADTVRRPVCIGGEVEYPPGSGEFFSYSPLPQEVPLGTDRFGCDTFALLVTELETGVFLSDTAVLCEGEVFTGCGFPDPQVGAGITTCTVPSNTQGGCDTIYVWTVSVLDPQAHIEAENGEITCANPSDVLHAVVRSGSTPPSSQGDSVTYRWTNSGGTVLGTSENITVTTPGDYTLLVTMTSSLRPNKSCTDMVTINIPDNSVAPTPPNISGPSDFCLNELPQSYTASGASGNDTYVWTTIPATGVTGSASGGTYTVTNVGSLTSFEVCVATMNSCGTSATACQQTTINPAPQQATFTGPTELCEGASGTYTIGNYNAANTYTVSSTPSGSATVSGSTVNFTMGATGGQLCITTSNACETLAPVCVNVNLLPDPVAVAPTGPTNVCVGAEETYTIYSSLPAGTTADVTVTGGTIINDQGSTVDIEWTTVGTGTVCVTYTNSCGTSSPACLNVTVESAGSAILAGGGAYCQGNNDVQVTITFVGAGPYNYTYTLNGTPQTGTATSSPVVLTNPAVGTYELTAFTVGSCQGTVSGTAQVVEDPTPTAAIAGGAQLCQGGSTDLTLTFTGDAPWTYEIALDGTGQGSQTTSNNPHTVSVSAAGTYTIASVESDAGCVGTTSGSAVVTILTPITFTPPAPVCSGTGDTYTVSFTISGGTGGPYTVGPSGAGSVSSGVFTSNPIASGDSYLFLIDDGAGCNPVPVGGDHTCPCTTDIGTLSTTPIEFCDDGTGVDFSAGYNPSNEFLDPNDVRIYVLHTGSGTTITGAIAQNSTGIFPFQTGLTYGTTYYVSVVVGNDYGSGGVDLADACTLVAPGTPIVFREVPSATLAGGGSVCVGADSTVTVTFTGTGPYTVEYSVGSNVITETTPSSPLTINLPNLQTNTTVTLNSVSAGSCSGTATGSAAFVVNQEIATTASETCNATSTAYTVEVIVTGGDPSSYSVTPPNGSFSGNVFTSNPIPAGDGYLFTFRDQFGCNIEVVSNQAVQCPCLSDAGTMSTTALQVCGTGVITVPATTGQFADGDDVLNYILHDGSGTAVGGTVYAQQAGPDFSFIMGTLAYGTTYYVSAVMGNSLSGVTDLTDPCLDVAAGTPVMWLREPSVVLSGDQDVCVGDPVTLTFEVDSDGPVTVTYTIGSSTQTANLTPGTNTVPGTIDVAGTYMVTGITAGPCSGTFSGSATVAVHQEISAAATTACNSTATAYTVEIVISGGEAPYTVTPATGTLTGNVFVSDPIPASTGYSFAVVDQWGCNTVTLARAIVDCDCLTRVGTLSGPFASCDPTEVATVTYDATGEFLDADDAVEYILHTGDFTMPLQRSTTPSFSFDPATMMLGTQYFITAVAGNATAGQVDFADNCTVTSNQVTVIWNPSPSVVLSGDQDVCTGDPINLVFDVTATGPVDVTYTNGTTTATVTMSPGTNNIVGTLNEAGTYTVTNIVQGPCTGTATGSATVAVHEEITATAVPTCDATATAYTVEIVISGGEAPYTVTPATGTLTGNIFVSDPIPASNGYSFDVVDQWGCNTVTLARAIVDCDCLTRIGTLSGPFASCDPTEVATVTYDATGEFLDADDAVEYILHTGDFTMPLQRSATPSFSFDPATMMLGTQYFITAVAGNATAGQVDFADACTVASNQVTVIWNPSPSVVLSGDQDVCTGDPINLVFDVTATGPVDVTYTNGTTTATVTMSPGTNNIVGTLNEAGTYTVTNIVQGPCTGTATGSATVAVHEEITATAVPTCDATATSYTVEINILGGEAPYTVTPATGTLTGNTFVSDPIPASDGYSFDVVDQWGCNTVTLAQNTVDCDCLTRIGTISGSFASCDETEVATIAYDATGEFLDADDAIEFILHTGDFTMPIQRSATPSFSFDPATMTFGTQYFVTAVAGNATAGQVDFTDNCTVATSQVPVIWSAPPTVVLSGDYTVCPGVPLDLMFDVTGPGTITVVYTDGTTDYTETFTAGNNVVSAPLSTDANYSIVSVNSAACPGTFSGSASVTILDGPAVGTPMVMINSTSTEYTITFNITGGDPATYTVNGNSLGGATSFTSQPIACGTAYNFTIDDDGGCDPVVITGNPNCNCLTGIGSLSGNFESCDLTASTSGVYDSSGENLDGDDAIEFLLYVSDPASPIARGNGPVFTFDPATMSTGVTYTIIGVAGNSPDASTVDLSDPCLQQTQPITATWYGEPGATMTAPSALCAGDDLVLTFNVTGTSEPKTVTFTIDGVADQVSNVVPGTPSTVTRPVSGNTTVELTGVSDSNCSATLSEVITIDVASEIFINNIEETCNATGTEYVVTFTLSGGDATTYQVTPAGAGTLSGTGPVVFTSDPIASGTPYTFTVTDASTCFSPEASGNPRCNCLTDAGDLDEQSQISVCEGDDIQVTFTAGSGFLDPDDVRLFALRTAGDRIDYTDDILATNTVPTFSSNGLTPGNTYFVSVIAGNDDGSGGIDDADGCLDIGETVPVFIQPLPTGNLMGDTLICETGSATITLVLVGNGPFDVTVGQGGDGSDTLLTNVNNGYTYQVSPDGSTIYLITDITDSSIPQCSNTSTGNITVGVEDLLNAGTASAEETLCEETGEVIQLSNQLTGADSGGAWTQVSGPTIGASFNPGAATVTNAGLDPGTYSFAYTVGSGVPCPTDTETWDVIIEAGPEADAGEDQVITCDEPVVALGGGSQLPGASYVWTGGVVADSTSATTTTNRAGVYTLTVTSGAAECQGIDQVVVDSDGDIPAFDNLRVSGETCIGDFDGSIITGVTGGSGPYSYSLDGSTPTSTARFDDVEPGEHELMVVDANGCVYIETVVVEAAKEVIVDAGPDVEIEPGTGHEVQLYLEGNVETVNWTGDSLVCTSTGPLCDEAILYPSFSTVYRVEVRDSNGCVDTDVIQLIVRSSTEVFVPSGFSPNGDGVNDIVYIRASEGVESVTNFRIFDRWGEVMFADAEFFPNDPDHGWDGRFRGEELNPGVFAYWCEVVYRDGSTEIFRGDITLVSNN